MSTAGLHRRLSRLEADMPNGPACRHGPAFVMPGEAYEPCPICRDEHRLVFRISVVPQDGPHVAPRSAVAATAGQGVGVGAQPPAPPDRPTGAARA